MPLDADSVKVAQITADSAWRSTLLTAGVGAFGIFVTGLAAVVTQLISGHNERARMQATQAHERLMRLQAVRREDYVAFSQALDEFQQAAFTVFDRNTQHESPEERTAQEQTLEEKFGPLDRANHSVQMLGSEDARATAQTIANHAGNEVREGALRQIHEIWPQTIRALSELRQQFEAQARADVQSTAK